MQVLPRPFCSVFMAISEDGFVSRPDGALDWLDEANQRVPPGEDCGYAAFMARMDALVMGRKTFDTVRGLGCWPYGDKPVLVLSRSMKGLPPGTPESVQRASGQVAVLLQALAAQGLQRLYIDGGTTVRGFLEAGLIDELILTQVPTNLGEGLRLFDAEGLPGSLQRQSVHTYPFGFVQSRYLFQPVQAPESGQRDPS